MATEVKQPIYNIYNILLGLIFLLLIVYIFIDKKPNHTGYNLYKVITPSAEGIKTKQLVLLNGVTVGFVNKISLQQNKPILELYVNNKYKIPADSYIFISNPSLFSSAKNINIMLGIGDDYLNNNDIIYNANIGLDLNKLLDLTSLYIQTLIK